MKQSLQAIRPVVGMAIGLILAMATHAQQGGPSYHAPNFSAFSAAGSQVSSRPVYGPRMPTSPLAGGISAARGDAFMDAHGNQIVMPAAYCEGCQAGDANYQMGGPCNGSYGYGCESDMAFSGVGCYGIPDQSGPHYFDISTGVVFLRGENLFEGAPAFASVGVGLDAPRLLDPSGKGDYEPGWQIAFRYDLGPLSLFEATYMGLYDISGSSAANSLAVTDPPSPFQLFSPFSNYGTGTTVPGVDFASVVRLDYESDLQSTELSYRRYWVDENPRITGTLLLGFRYLRLTEDFTYHTIALAGDSIRLWDGENDLLGAQVGGDGWITLRQGLRLGGEVKAGLYNNHYVFTNAGDLPDVADDFESTSKGDQVAFAAEGSVSLVIDILPSFSLRGDYQVLYMNSLATAGGNIDPANYSSTAVQTQSDAFYHGFNAGLEYIW